MLQRPLVNSLYASNGGENISERTHKDKLNELSNEWVINPCLVKPALFFVGVRESTIHEDIHYPSSGELLIIVINSKRESRNHYGLSVKMLINPISHVNEFLLKRVINRCIEVMLVHISERTLLIVLNEESKGINECIDGFFLWASALLAYDVTAFFKIFKGKGKSNIGLIHFLNEAQSSKLVGFLVE